MIRSASILILCGGLGLSAQNTTTTANTGPGSTSSGQTITGILMDASCSSIANAGNQAGLSTYSAPGQTPTSNDAVQNSTTSTSSVTHSGRSSPTEGIRNNSASTTGTTGTADTTGSTSSTARVSDRDSSAVAGQGTTTPSDLSRTAAARAADERHRMGTNVTGTSQVAGAASSSATGPGNSSATATAGTTGVSTSADATTSGSSHIAGAAGRSTSTGATSGASSASAHGTTGAATDSATASPDGTRSRAAEGSATTVREKYAECTPKATTTAFAIHADGQLYVLDQAGNDMVRQQMGNEAFRGAMTDASGQPKWHTVTVVGTPGANNTLSITSVRK